MLFNSLEFFLFLPLAFFFYWALVSNRKAQNAFLLVASYIFYGWWDWRFLVLIIVSSLADFLIGRRLLIIQSQDSRRWLLGLSLVINLGILGFFKYFNFFISSFAEMLNLLGFQPNVYSLNVVLPVGISFYTFQTLSYTIDIYRREIQPTHNWLEFFAFVSFFPQLVAGPIERARNLLPQFSRNRLFDLDKSKDGLRQILWGLFKKVVVADNCAQGVDWIFNNYDNTSGSVLVLGAVLFAFQIYGDFSGYSDIAIGTAKLFGFNLMTNFRNPYFSTGIGDFWKRWHISLSTWFRDYVYIPLGGNRVSPMRRSANSAITFVISGLWHGANWTFVIWGGLHAIYYTIERYLMGLNNYQKIVNGSIAFKVIISISTFGLVSISWVFFRAPNLTHALGYLRIIMTRSTLSIPDYSYYSLIWIALLLIVEWTQKNKEHAMEVSKQPVVFRWASYTVIINLVVLFGSFSERSFIYFQF